MPRPTVVRVDPTLNNEDRRNDRRILPGPGFLGRRLSVWKEKSIDVRKGHVGGSRGLERQSGIVVLSKIGPAGWPLILRQGRGLRGKVFPAEPVIGRITVRFYSRSGRSRRFYWSPGLFDRNIGPGPVNLFAVGGGWVPRVLNNANLTVLLRVFFQMRTTSTDTLSSSPSSVFPLGKRDVTCTGLPKCLATGFPPTGTAI